MHKHLKIADMYIYFTYTYNDFFSDKIDTYVTKETNKDFVKFSVSVEEGIESPNRNITYTYKNRFKMETEIDCYLMTKDTETDKIKHLIYYKKDYSQVRIVLNKYLGDKLAEYEYVLSGMFFFEIAINQKYLPIHASAMHHNNHTFLLSGPSKSGKSTQTKYYKEVFPKTLIINEDKPIIFLKDNRLFVSGTPWSGKHVINDNSIYPLEKIFIIEKGDDLSIVEMDKTRKIKELFRNIHRPGERKLIDNTIELMNKIIIDTPVYTFKCINDISSAYYINKFLEDNQ